MVRKGRPPQSEIRQNIVEILYNLGSAYGYQISKLYRKIFAPATQRVMYYHLKKGIELGEFQVDKVVHEKGNFSWGSTAEKTYYKLGKNARPKGDIQVKEAIDKSYKKV